jgi:hypothetical protein
MVCGPCALRVYDSLSKETKEAKRRFFERHFGPPPGLFVLDPLGEELGEGLDGDQGIADFVGQAGDEGAQRSQPVRPAHDVWDFQIFRGLNFRWRWHFKG